MDGFRERLERRLFPRQLDGPPSVARLLGFARQRLERRDDTLAVLVARLEHPLVVDAGQ
jgi:hypothetical protein